MTAISVSHNKGLHDDRRSSIHVVAGLDAAHGGPSYSVPRLCEALAHIGAETTLLSVVSRHERPSDRVKSGYRERRFDWDFEGIPGFRALRNSTGLARELRNAASSANIIHNHGLWLMPNVYAGQEAMRARVPLVVSPRGMLSPAALGFSQLKKRAFWHLLQAPSVLSAGCIHATSESEYQDIRLFGLVNPVAIIPNGIDLPEMQHKTETSAGPGRVVLSLGRIHPKKGLEHLLRAWANLETRNPGWRLRVVGPSEAGHDNELRALASTLRISRATIEGPIYGERKLAAYREADVFVLPSLNENFGLTVAEALAAGTPVISTKGAPWRALEINGCGWWIDHGVEPLTASLANAMTMTQATLKAMGAKGRALMERDFSWSRVGTNMLELYGWLTNKRSVPAFVRID